MKSVEEKAKVMLVLRGATAHSPFRINKLLVELRLLEPKVTGLESEWVHFALIEGELDPEKRRLLERILQYGPRSRQVTGGGVPFLVVPRPGTISPWSSKATDIAHNCGLSEIIRLERGCRFYLACDGPVGEAAAARLAARLHDRMTQALLPGLAIS